MKIKLTPSFVRTAAPPRRGDRTIYWDAALPCFGLVVTANGHRSFVVQYRANGVSRRLTFNAAALSLDKAKREAKKVIGDIARGGDPLAERRKAAAAAGDTFQAIAEEFFARDGKALRSKHKQRLALGRLVYPKLGARPIGEIRRSDIARLLDRIAAENGPAQADLVLAYMRKILNWHAARSDDFRSPIVRGMAKTKPSERRRQRILNDDELRAIWKATEANPCAFSSLVQFVLLTATRRNEAARMKPSEVSGNEWTIPAARYKTGLELLVPLSGAAMQVLQKTLRIGDRWIFTNDGRRALAAFGQFKSKLQKASHTSGWTLHDLRRTARSLMSRAGVSSDIAERALGHVMGGIRGTYDRHSYANEKRQAFEALAGLIERIIDPQPNVTQLRG
jgi:integrase